MGGIDEIVHVPVGAAGAFLARIEAVNARARRLRLGISVAVEAAGEARRPVRVTREAFRDGSVVRETRDEVRPCALFRLTCDEPRVAIPGWEFAGYVAAKGAIRDVSTGAVSAASYSPFAEGGRLPAGFLAEAFTERGMMRCDHCRTFRNRRLGIVVRGPGGEHRIVGSSCAPDYLGHDPKAILSHFQNISLLRRDLDAQREVGWYRIVEVDRTAERRAEARARRRRETRAYDLVEVVAAQVAAMVEQGFHARYDGGAKRSTAGRAEEMLASRRKVPGGALSKAREVVRWAVDRRHPLIADLGDRVTLAAYAARDPEHRLVENYRAAGNPLVGDFHDGSVPVAIVLVESREIPVDDLHDRGRAWAGSGRFVHEFLEPGGGRLTWETSSPSPAREYARGVAVESSFEVRRTWIGGVTACHAVRKVRPFRDRGSPRRKG